MSSTRVSTFDFALCTVCIDCVCASVTLHKVRFLVSLPMITLKSKIKFVSTKIQMRNANANGKHIQRFCFFSFTCSFTVFVSITTYTGAINETKNLISANRYFIIQKQCMKIRFWGLQNVGVFCNLFCDTFIKKAAVYQY